MPRSTMPWLLATAMAFAGCSSSGDPKTIDPAASPAPADVRYYVLDDGWWLPAAEARRLWADPNDPSAVLAPAGSVRIRDARAVDRATFTWLVKQAARARRLDAE